MAKKERDALRFPHFEMFMLSYEYIRTDHSIHRWLINMSKILGISIDEILAKSYSKYKEYDLGSKTPDHVIYNRLNHICLLVNMQTLNLQEVQHILEVNDDADVIKCREALTCTDGSKFDKRDRLKLTFIHKCVLKENLPAFKSNLDNSKGLMIDLYCQTAGKFKYLWLYMLLPKDKCLLQVKDIVESVGGIESAVNLLLKQTNINAITLKQQIDSGYISLAMYLKVMLLVVNDPELLKAFPAKKAYSELIKR